MKKVVDIDKLFEKYFRKIMLENKGKFSEDDWLEKLPEYYEQFENTSFPELDGKTPATFFDGDDDLLATFLAYVKSGVPISDRLFDAVATGVEDGRLYSLLNEKTDEETLLATIEVVRRKNVKYAINEYIDLFFAKKVCGHVKNEIVADMIDNADVYAPLILDRVGEADVSDALCEVLAHSSKKCDKIKRILINGLEKGDRVPEFAAFLTQYDDESCVPQMKEYLKKVFDYVSYNELTLAIEALGGQVEGDRDFSFDEDYIKIKGANNDSVQKD